MALGRVSLRSFLSSAKNALDTSIQQASPITFVIGNESADLDSICSAVLLAYLRTYSTPFSRPNTLYIPLSNLPRADLSLRPELIPALSHADLKPSDLITLSDLPPLHQISSQVPTGATRWLLVDHNALQGELGKIYASRVVGCIDHHDEEGRVPQETGDEPRIVRKSGSCASLIVEYCREAWDSLSARSAGGDPQQRWDAELAYLALAPVLVDTTNLTIRSKVTTADTEAVRYLEKRISEAASGEAFDTVRYFEELSDAKHDIGGLSLRDILRKDYKAWNEDGLVLGISAVVKDIRFLIGKAGSREKFLDALKEFAMERNQSVCSIMTTAVHNGVFKRELLVWGIDGKGTEAAKKFERDWRGKLGLEKWTEEDLDVEEVGQWRKCWWQERVENSRKQVAPLLRECVVK